MSLTKRNMEAEDYDHAGAWDWAEKEQGMSRQVVGERIPSWTRLGWIANELELTVGRHEIDIAVERIRAIAHELQEQEQDDDAT